MWRVLLVFPVFFAIIQLIGLFIFQKEDPRYEEHCKNRYSSYETSISNQSNIRKTSNYNIQQTSEISKSRLEKDTWVKLFSKSNRKRLFAGSIVRFLQQFSGLDIALNFAYYFRFTPNNVFFNLRFVVAIISIFATLISMFILKFYKRRLILLIG
mmetsp:Transcript_20414/g.18074  ORF Transcript_20414/g.18074 Transcript_20414/m.18074 type:complete len:155 (-) Transcript_20414:490-954(-)